eukprot:TRINITY_DN3445_c0_g1_i1.p1 TRINITY_DN3445_c0_g1~~TRINITY_DN3445_c0_g1_i1.p1  ORF type:complete len:180 (-),score=13.00 TRINITY_DN3445_c0_g1_i1:182-658(-)
MTSQRDPSWPSIDRSVMNTTELKQFLLDAFPTNQQIVATYEVEEVTKRGVRVRLPFNERFTRPGGTISGPIMMEMVDTVSYLAVCSRIGPVPLTVTSSLNINFLRKPKQGYITAHADILKLGRTLAVLDVKITSMEDPEPVAQASCTYSIPEAPKSKL